MAGQSHPINLHVQGARGLCAMMVFTYHIYRAEVPTFETVHSGVAGVILRTMEYGVDLFFCISGFVILGALYRAASGSEFLRDRAIRIYPVLWPPLFVSLVYGLMFHHREFAKVSTETVFLSLPANLLALPGVFDIFLIHPVAWSLSYEMAFYVFCASAWYLSGRWGSASAARVWLPVAAVLLTFYPRAMFFLPGLIVALHPTAGGRLLRVLQRFPFAMLCLTLAAWGGIQAMTGPVHLVRTTLLAWATDWRLPLAMVAIAAATLFMRGIVNGEGVLGRFLAWRPWIALGTISYSFYLWHIPAVALVRRFMLMLHLEILAGPASQLVMFALALPLSVLLAWLSWRLVERSFCSWLRARLPHALPRGRRAAAPAEELGSRDGVEAEMLPRQAAGGNL
ncbi:MAG: acyltransferase [Acetobacteraceae bacterium]